MSINPMARPVPSLPTHFINESNMAILQEVKNVNELAKIREKHKTQTKLFRPQTGKLDSRLNGRQNSLGKAAMMDKPIAGTRTRSRQQLNSHALNQKSGMTIANDAESEGGHLKVQGARVSTQESYLKYSVQNSFVGPSGSRPRPITGITTTTVKRVLQPDSSTSHGNRTALDVKFEAFNN